MIQLNSIFSGFTPLTHLGVIAAKGADAASFLQGQLSNDFLLLREHEARLAAYCSPKGRMLASFIGVKNTLATEEESPEILLICNADVLPATLKRLNIFVMRAKLKLRDASTEFRLCGLLGQALSAILQTALPPDPAPAESRDAWASLSQWARHECATGLLVGLPPALNQARGLFIQSAALTPAWPTPAPELPASTWAYLDVMSGVAHINASAVDAFVPQMLNYESVGGVSFKKGCYPGQEVVTRSQFRGSIKRRGYIVHSATALAPGQSVGVLGSDDVLGTVVQAAAVPTNAGMGWVGIASLQSSAVQRHEAVNALTDADGGIQQVAAPGETLVAWANAPSSQSAHPIQVLPLPYELALDI
jgi:tRNA-modifying protein YgfZ